MSSEPAPADPAAPPKPAKPSKLIVPLLILNLGGTGFAVFKLLTGGGAAHAGAPAHETTKVKEDKTGPIVPLEPFVVNLNETGQSRYLKISLKLEVANSAAQKQIEKKVDLVRDMVLSHLSGLSVTESLGAEAKDKIRDALRVGIEEIIGEGTIKRVFFGEFVVQ
jgi:flagellar FliL protein